MLQGDWQRPVSLEAFFKFVVVGTIIVYVSLMQTQHQVFGDIRILTCTKFVFGWNDVANFENLLLYQPSRGRRPYSVVEMKVGIRIPAR